MSLIVGKTALNALRPMLVADDGSIDVNVHGGAVGSGDMKARSVITDPATSTFIKCNTDGTLEMTAELDSSGLSKETTQLLVKSAVEVGHGAGNNTRGNIGDGATNQNVVCLGYDQPNGKMVSIDVDSDGRLNTKCMGNNAGTNVQIKVDANGVVETSGGGGGSSDSTAANQVLMITDLGVIKGDTTSLDSKVVACDTGAVAGTVAVSSVAGNVAITAAALPLPSGAATSALQTTQETTLDAIEVLQTAANVDLAAIEVLQTAANVDLAALEVLQTTIAGSHYTDNQSFGGSDTGVLVMGRDGSNLAQPIHITNNGDVEVEIADFVKGQAAMAASFPVVLASDQAAIPVTIAALPLPSGGATAALQTTQETTLDAIEVLVTAGNAILSTIDTDTGAMVVDLAAIEISNAAIKVATEASAVDLAALEVLSTAANVDLAALEVLSTAANVDLAAIEVLQTTIAGDTTSIDGKITACNTGAVVVSSSALPSGAATSAKQDIAEVTLNALEVLSTAANVDLAAIEVLQTTIAGDTSSLDAKITACNTGAVVLAAGTAAIGKLAANSGVDIGDVDVLSLPAKVNSDTTLWSVNTAITNGATLTSAVIDKNGAYRLSAAIAVDANGGSGYSIQAQGSADNSTYFDVGMPQMLTNPSLSKSIEFDTSFRYVKVKITNSVGSDRQINYSVASHANGL